MCKLPAVAMKLGLMLIAAVLQASALAQSYPTRPVKLIVTYPPGGSSDPMARVFGQKLGELWGQTVIIESKPGAAGPIGMDYAAKQAPDGYTFVVGNIGPAPAQPSVHRIKYRLVYVVGGERIVGYDNERGKGDHKRIRGVQAPYVFKDVLTLIRDFFQDVEETES